MTKAQDNLFPYISVVETAVPANPAAGNQKLYIDPADHLLKRVDSSGAVVTLGSSPSTTFALTGDITPSQITSNQNDYNPTSLSSAAILRLSTDASRNITGLQGGADGRIIVIYNVGSFNIVIKDDDGATSTAANRFALSGDVTLAPDDGITLIYDSTATRWRCIGKSPGGATSSSGRVLIQSQTPTGTGTVTFSSISSSYQKLIIEFVARGTASAGSVSMDLVLNNDTTNANYRTIAVGWYASTTLGAGAAIDDNIIENFILANTGPSNEASYGVIEIPFYAGSTFQKQVLYRSGKRLDTSSNQEHGNLTVMDWENTAAINRIDLILSSGNFASGTTINLYGES